MGTLKQLGELVVATDLLFEELLGECGAVGERTRRLAGVAAGLRGRMARRGDSEDAPTPQGKTYM